MSICAVRRQASGGGMLSQSSQDGTSVHAASIYTFTIAKKLHAAISCMSECGFPCAVEMDKVTESATLSKGRHQAWLAPGLKPVSYCLVSYRLASLPVSVGCAGHAVSPQRGYRAAAVNLTNHKCWFARRF